MYQNHEKGAFTLENQTYSFRSALSGFNRADVIAFIGQLSASHEAELRERDEELRLAREELERLQKENGRLVKLVTEQSEAKPGDRQPEQPAGPAEPEIAQPIQEKELEVYRRAERCEREARVRAEKVYSAVAAEVDGAGKKLLSQEERLLDVSSSLADDIASLQSTMVDICEQLSGTRARVQSMGQDLAERR